MTNVGKNMEKRYHSCIVGGNVKQNGHSGKQFGNSYKTEHAITIWPNAAIVLLTIYSR